MAVEWEMTSLSVANRVYPKRFEIELADAIATYEPEFDGLTGIPGTYEYQFLMERDDFQSVLAARFDELHAMRDRYHAAVETDDLESLLFPD